MDLFIYHTRSSAWHQTISERLENNSDHFLGGPRSETGIAHLNTAAGLMTDCYKIIEPSTTTNIESWVCRGVGLVRRLEEREGGEGHGSLVYRSETRLLRYDPGFGLPHDLLPVDSTKLKK